MTRAAGFATIDVPIPVHPALAGFEAWFQAAEVLAGPQPFAASPGLHVRVGG